ncbi:MAG TPA: MGMT family protein [Methanomassiliicoccales archaeon]|nr:MGMT family protein [Methanomassiliicoccales archaeon]
MTLETSETAKRAYDMLLQVPKGRVTTYGALAKAIGKPKAARLVGAIMRGNPHAPRVPCHRVVKSDGTLGGYSGSDPANIKRKVQMLHQEGVEVDGDRVVDFERVFFDDFKRK